MTARAAGWDVLSSRLVETRESPRRLVEVGVKDVGETIERERKVALGMVGGGGEAEGKSKGKGEGKGELRERTRWNLRKALRYRSSEDVKRFGDKVQEHMVRPFRLLSRGPHTHRAGAAHDLNLNQSYQSYPILSYPILSSH